jgi:anti-sigma factor RsiW
MSCPKFEADVALYAGGDLPARRMARIESHLGACPDCRALVEELSAGQELLSELREAPLEDAMVAQVRRRVMARVTAEKTRGAVPYWKLALAAALVLAAILSLTWRSGKPPQLANEEAPARMAPAPASVPPVEAVPVRHRVVRRHGRPPLHHAQAAQPSAPLLVHFVTDDPNIVIYWLVEQKPQGD